jgi:hypothetical protein
MPRGVPKNGFRLTKNKKAEMGLKPTQTLQTHMVSTKELTHSNETDEQIELKLQKRFELLRLLTQTVITGDSRAMIVSGPAGLGKSYEVEQALKAWDPEGNDYEIVKGYSRPTGLYKKFWKHKDEGHVLVFDDADSIYFDDVALNMLKAVCDTTENRRVSWLSEKPFEDEDGNVIPSSFEFKGAIIFITNINFDRQIAQGSKLAPHLEALVSRSHYVDLKMNTKQDYIVRIRQVVRGGMLRQAGLDKQQGDDVMSFIEKNQDNLRELSLRMAIKVGTLRKNHEHRWADLASMTCFRT